MRAVVDIDLFRDSGKPVHCLRNVPLEKAVEEIERIISEDARSYRIQVFIVDK